MFVSEEVKKNSQVFCLQISELQCIYDNKDETGKCDGHIRLIGPGHLMTVVNLHI